MAVWTLIVCLLAFLSSQVWALAPSNRLTRQVSAQVEGDTSSVSRRAMLSTCTFVPLWGAWASTGRADTGAEVRGTSVTPFNGLAFQYRGSEFDGLKASDIDEPSISYNDFMQRLKAGHVKFVEFLAPDGDKAYATFLGDDGKPVAPIRIGEGEFLFAQGVCVTHSCHRVDWSNSNGNNTWAPPGYPIEQHDGYSSPAFAIRAVKNAGVPYKFSVPALSSYKSS